MLTTKPVSGTTACPVQAAPVPPTPKQALVALIADVTWHLGFLTGAAEDIGTALDAVLDGAEFEDAEVMTDITYAVESVSSELDNVGAIERAVEQLEAVAAAISDDASAAEND